MTGENRRSFLKKTSIASLAAAGTAINLNPAALGANEKIRLALIGCRSRGWQVAGEAPKLGAEIHTLCDIDPQVLEDIGGRAEEAQGSKPKTCMRYEEVLADKNIDAVIIATPDHWHAAITILACQADKDVYVEKPLSHTIQEGQLMRDAARRYQRVMQVGLQRRSMNHFKSAVEYVASGQLGKLCLVKAWMCQVRGSIGHPPDSDPPAGVDYDRWLGPAPKRPFNKNRFHYNWRFFWDYCNSELGNQGVHMLDIALWGIQAIRGSAHQLPTRVSSQDGIFWKLDDLKEVPDTQVVTYDFGDLLLSWELRSFLSHHPIEGTEAGTGFYSNEGCLIVEGDRWKVYRPDGSKEIEEKASGGSHLQNFLDCIKSREQPNSDIELGRLSTTLCHLGNISHHLRREVVFDPATETFGNDREANQRLSKEYREPYGLPKV